MAAGEAMLMLPQLPAHLAAKYVQSLHLQPFMQAAFFTGLALLIIGNGFFKPNISTIVGTLYAKYPGKRDGGFTIFYMGINLGAAMSPLLCGYVGETYGWSWGFGLATVGMLIGLAVFVLPRLLTAVAILCGAIAAAGGLVWFHPVEILSTAVNIFVAASVLGAAVVAAVAISRGGLPHDAGRPAHPGRLQRRILGLPAAWLVYLGAIVLVPAFMLLVSGGVLLTANGHPVVFIPDKTISQLEKSASPLAHVGAVCLKEVSTPVGLILALSGLLAFGYLGVETFRLDRIGRHRMYVILILVFFSMLFWAFAEQAGSSINNFTDRNVRRVITTAATPVIDRADLGKTIELQPTQEQLGFHNGDRLFTIDVLNKLRERSERQEGFPDRMEGGGGQRGHEDRAPRRRNPRQPLPGRQPCLHHAAGVGVLGPLELSGRAGVGAEHAAEVRLGALAAWAGFRGFLGRRQLADQRGMVAVGWLLLGYLLQTTGELCLSPVGLAMITRLSPAVLVSTVMGAWFLSNAFAQLLAAIIALFTRVGDSGAAGAIPPPCQTLHIYASVYGMIAIAAAISALICFTLVPLLKKWMHEGEQAVA